MLRSTQHDSASYGLFSGRVRPNPDGVGFAGLLISGPLRYFSEGTVRQGRPDSELPGPVDRTFFFGNRNLPYLSGPTPRLAGYLRRARLGLRRLFPPPGSESIRR